MLRHRFPIPQSAALRTIFAGSFLNLVTPTAKLAGGVFRAALLRNRTGWRFATAYGWTLADQVTNILSSLGLYGLLATGASYGMPASGPRTLFFLTGAGALLFVGLFLAFRPWLWSRIQRAGPESGMRHLIPKHLSGTRENRDRSGWLAASLAPLLHEGTDWKSTARDLGLAMLSWSALCLANAMVFRAVGVDAPLLQVAAVLVLGAFAGSLTGLGGIGVTEAAMIGLYAQLGIDPTAAVAASLLHRATFYVTVLVCGGWSLFRARTSRDGGSFGKH
jgi:uncharacterized membrane protein YbhN (UPF0104 family)